MPDQIRKEDVRMKKLGGLRKRWLLNTAGVVFALGMVCVLVVTLVFAAYYYSNMESDMRYRAKTTTDFFAEYINQSYNEYYQSCINYANSFEERNTIELQFINASGHLVVSSYGNWAGLSPVTQDVSDALNNRIISSFTGTDPHTGERIVAVSSPMIYSSGEVIGVLRYVTSTRILDFQILKIFLFSLVILAIAMLVVIFSSSYYIRSILIPVNEITEKAKRITSGSYGIQIQTHYDDEIGELAQTINERL